MIKFHLTDSAQQFWDGKCKYDWVHLSLTQDIPPTSGGSYKYLVWDILKKRSNKDVLICKYVPESFQIAQKSEHAVCQFDVFSKDFNTALECRFNWLRSFVFLKKRNVILENVAKWIKQTGGKKLLLWGGGGSLQELRRLLPDMTIAYSQRHYGYPSEVSNYNNCDVLITQTPGQAKYAYANSRRLDPFVLTIPNGVEIDQFTPPQLEAKLRIRKELGIKLDNFVIIFPSKLAIYKGSRYLERLINISDQALPGATFLVVGGLHKLTKHLNHKQSLEKILNEHPSVKWCGNVPREDMPRLLTAADVCLMPATLREGFSMAGIEAMAAGLPLVATASGCYPEIIKDRCNGLLCDEGNLFGNLLTALQECLTDRTLVENMAKNARDYVEKQLTRDKILQNYCNFLDGKWEKIDSTM